MPKPPSDAEVLARWTHDAPAWRRFVLALRDCSRPGFIDRAKGLDEDAPDAGRTVVVTRDAVFLGDERFDFGHYYYPRLAQGAHWLELDDESENAHLGVPIPMPTDATVAARMLSDLHAHVRSEER